LISNADGELTERRLNAARALKRKYYEQVDDERVAQNQTCSSMDKRANLQLRLQRQLKGLSVVAVQLLRE
jgi:uncharacterized membrane-anchored protein